MLAEIRGLQRLTSRRGNRTPWKSLEADRREQSPTERALKEGDAQERMNPPIQRMTGDCTGEKPHRSGGNTETKAGAE
jgi:hypothetical protein